MFNISNMSFKIGFIQRFFSVFFPMLYFLRLPAQVKMDLKRGAITHRQDTAGTKHLSNFYPIIFG